MNQCCDFVFFAFELFGDSNVVDEGSACQWRVKVEQYTSCTNAADGCVFALELDLCADNWVDFFSV